MGSVGEEAPGQPDVVPRNRWKRGQASYRRDHSRLQRRGKHHPYQCTRPHNLQARSQLPSQPRQRNCPRPHHPHPCSQFPSPPRQRHRLPPAATNVRQHRRLLRAVRGALRFEKISNVRPLSTAAAPPACLSTHVGGHATCEMSNSIDQPWEENTNSLLFFTYTHRQGLQLHTLRDYNTSSLAVPKLLNTRERPPVKIVKQRINSQVYFTNTIS